MNENATIDQCERRADGNRRDSSRDFTEGACCCSGVSCMHISGMPGCVDYEEG